MHSCPPLRFFLSRMGILLLSFRSHLGLAPALCSHLTNGDEHVPTLLSVQTCHGKRPVLKIQRRKDAPRTPLRLEKLIRDGRETEPRGLSSQGCHQQLVRYNMEEIDEPYTPGQREEAAAVLLLFSSTPV